MSEGPVGEKEEMGDTEPPSVQGLTALGDCVSCNCYTLAILLYFYKCICKLLQCFRFSNGLKQRKRQLYCSYVRTQNI